MTCSRDCIDIMILERTVERYQGWKIEGQMLEYGRSRGRLEVERGSQITC